MHTSRTLLEWIFGSIFGSNPVTSEGKFLVYAHSAYIDQIEFVGYLGLLLSFSILLGSLFIFKGSYNFNLIGKMLVFATLIYGYTYRFPYVVFCFIGILFSILNKKQKFIYV